MKGSKDADFSLVFINMFAASIRIYRTWKSA